MPIREIDDHSSGGWPAVRAGGTPAFGVARGSAQAPVVLAMVGPDGVIRSIHGRFDQAFHPRVGESFSQELPEQARPKLMAALGRAFEGETLTVRSDGEGSRRFDVTLVPMRVERGVSGVAVVFRETSSVVEREAERGILRHALDATEEGIVVFVAGPAREVVFHNLAFVALAGNVVTVGRPLRLTSDDETATEQALSHVVSAGEPRTLEVSVTSPTGELRVRELDFAPIRASGGPVTMWVAVARDVTQRRALEEQVRRAAAVDAMGRLAAGAAHDFNNLLAAMTMELAFLREVVEDTEARESLGSLDGAVQRARGVIGRLLAMTRPGTSTPQRVDLRTIVQGASRDAARLVDPSVQVETELTPEPVWLLGDPIQLEQVVHNLVANAAEASREGDVVRVELTTDGEVARLRVVDHGCGMSSEVAAKAFLPLFTTKGTRGTGLGLTTVDGVVKAHGGDVELRTAPTVGTRVTVVLPLLEPDQDDSERWEQQMTGEFFAAPGMHVLLVEDQPILRTGIARALERRGYRVSTARDGAEALERLSDDVSIVLSDVVMPGMDGVELARRLRARDKAVAVLLMSGYRDPLLGEIPSGVKLLPKPFRPSALLAQIEALLAANGSS